MIRYVKGDLFTSGATAFAHGCNCRGVMGAGIAVQFRQRWPAMYEAYRKKCGTGGFWPGDVMPWRDDDGMVVFNLATQYEPGPNVRSWMITAAAGRMIQLACYGYGITEIALPVIGCGIGGLGRADLGAALAPYEDAPVSLIVVEYAPRV